MEKLFYLWKKNLYHVASRTPPGATLYAIELQLQRMFNRATCSGDGDTTRKRKAIADFENFSRSSFPTSFNQSAVLVRAKTILLGWFSLTVGDCARLEAKGCRAIASSNRSSVYDGRAPGAYPKRVTRLHFTAVDSASEYNALISKHRWDLCLARASRRPDYIGAMPRISTVPKNATVDRTISVQPTGNLELQRYWATIVKDLMYRAVQFSFSAPPTHWQQDEWNKELARLGSLGGPYATMDLRRASDSLSPALLEFLLPEWLMAAVRQCVPVETTSRVVLTMGCDLTFPLQTAIFLAITMAAHELCSLPTTLNQDLACWGDDIICHPYAYRSLELALVQAGCSVNTEKSYCSGPFRESCGGWFYQGFDVKPFEAKVDLDRTSPACRAYVINGITDWYRRMDLSLPYTILRECVRMCKAHDLPFVSMVSDWKWGVRISRPTRSHTYHGSMWHGTRLDPVTPAWKLAWFSPYLVQAHLNGDLASGRYLADLPGAHAWKVIPHSFERFK